MSEEKIEIGSYVELFKCQICGKICGIGDDTLFEREVMVNGQKISISTSKSHGCRGFTACPACYNIFYLGIDDISEELENRVGLHKMEIIVRNEEKTND